MLGFDDSCAHIFEACCQSNTARGIPSCTGAQCSPAAQHLPMLLLGGGSAARDLHLTVAAPLSRSGSCRAFACLLYHSAAPLRALPAQPPLASLV